MAATVDHCKPNTSRRTKRTASSHGPDDETLTELAREMHASIENSKRVMSVVDKVQAEFEEAQAREGEAHDSLQRYLAYRDIAAVVIAGRIYQRDDIDINDPWLTSPVVVLPD